MDNRAYKQLLLDGPQVALLDAVDSGQDHTIFVPLLEAELQRSSSRLQRLKEYRNALTSPMYRLLPEILSSIFFIYAQVNDELFDLRWTRLLLVCRRWHDIAMNTPRLWSFIDVGPPERGNCPISLGENELDSRDVRRIELQRSRAALTPLTIIMSLHEHLSGAKLAYTTLYWNPGSLHSFTVNGEKSYLKKMVHILAAHHHANLMTLELHCFSYRGTPVFQSPLDTVLRDNAPRLLHFAVTEIVFDLALLHGLRSLRIAYVSGTSMPFTVQDVVNVVSRCPELEYLALRLPPSFRPDIFISPVSAPLPHLDVVAIQATNDVCTQLFQAMPNIPSSTKLIASANDTRPVDNSLVFNLATQLGSHASREGAPTIHSVKIILLRGPPVMNEDIDGNIVTSRFRIVGQPTSRCLDRSVFIEWLYTNAHDNPPCISIDAGTSAAAEVPILGRILQGWPISMATHLDIRVAQLTSEHLNVMLPELPGVLTIVLRPESSTTQALLEILQVQLEHGRRIFANIIFDAAGVAHAADRWITDDVLQPSGVRARRNLMRTMLYCSQAARAGMPLDTIEIANESPEARHRLLASADNVEWSELYDNLQHGFVYEKVLHTGNPDLDGCAWDSGV